MWEPRSRKKVRIMLGKTHWYNKSLNFLLKEKDNVWVRGLYILIQNSFCFIFYDRRFGVCVRSQSSWVWGMWHCLASPLGSAFRTIPALPVFSLQLSGLRACYKSLSITGQCLQKKLIWGKAVILNVNKRQTKILLSSHRAARCSSGAAGPSGWRGISLGWLPSVGLLF